jgi:hypothetical protein
MKLTPAFMAAMTGIHPFMDIVARQADHISDASFAAPARRAAQTSPRKI